MLKRISMFALVSLVVVGVGWAATIVPTTFNVQGRITLPDGKPDVGKKILFKLPDLGNALVPANKANGAPADPVMTDANGVFNATLNWFNDNWPDSLAINGLPGKKLRIEIFVANADGSNPVSYGIQEVIATPYSFLAQKAENLTPGTKTIDNLIVTGTTTTSVLVVDNKAYLPGGDNIYIAGNTLNTHISNVGGGGGVTLPWKPMGNYDAVITATSTKTPHGTGLVGLSVGDGTDATKADAGVYGFNLNTGPGVYGGSVNGAGVYGKGLNAGVAGSCVDKTGVLGFSENGVGVNGISVNGEGVKGSGKIAGGSFNSVNGLGVEGKSTNSYGASFSSANSDGLLAQATADLKSAIKGSSFGNNSNAIFGQAAETDKDGKVLNTVGVKGTGGQAGGFFSSTNGIGVLASGKDVGVRAFGAVMGASVECSSEQNGYGIFGATKANGTGVYGTSKGIWGNYTARGVMGEMTLGNIPAGSSVIGVEGKVQDKIYGRLGVWTKDLNSIVDYYGVFGETTSGYGVFGRSKNGVGVVAIQQDDTPYQSVKVPATKAGLYASSTTIANPAIKVGSGFIEGSANMPITAVDLGLPVTPSWANNALTIGNNKDGWDVLIYNDLVVSDKTFFKGKIYMTAKTAVINKQTFNEAEIPANVLVTINAPTGVLTLNDTAYAVVLNNKVTSNSIILLTIQNCDQFNVLTNYDVGVGDIKNGSFRIYLDKKPESNKDIKVAFLVIN